MAILPCSAAPISSTTNYISQSWWGGVESRCKFGINQNQNLSGLSKPSALIQASSQLPTEPGLVSKPSALIQASSQTEPGLVSKPSVLIQA